MGAQAQGAASGRWAVIPRTLTFLRCGDDVLLMKRSPHSRIFPGRYNGLGGHIEREEDPRTSALRELCEETGLNADQIRGLRLCGLSHVDAGQTGGIMVFVFTAETDRRDVTDSDEGRLEWVSLSRLLQAGLGNASADLNLPLVDDLPMLLPRLFGPNAASEPFFAHVHYDAHDHMIMTFAG